MHFFALSSKLVFRRARHAHFLHQLPVCVSVCVCLRTLSTSLSCALPKKEGRKNANSIKYNAEALAQAPHSLHPFPVPPSLYPPLPPCSLTMPLGPVCLTAFHLAARCGFLFILNAFPTSTNTRTRAARKCCILFGPTKKSCQKGFFPIFAAAFLLFFVSLSALP